MDEELPDMSGQNEDINNGQESGSRLYEGN